MCFILFLSHSIWRSVRLLRVQRTYPLLPSMCLSWWYYYFSSFIVSHSNRRETQWISCHFPSSAPTISSFIHIQFEFICLFSSLYLNECELRVCLCVFVMNVSNKKICIFTWIRVDRHSTEYLVIFEQAHELRTTHRIMCSPPWYISIHF